MTQDKTPESDDSVPTHTEETEIAATLGATAPGAMAGPFGTPGDLLAGAAILNILTPQDGRETPEGDTSESEEEKA